MVHSILIGLVIQQAPATPMPVGQLEICVQQIRQVALLLRLEDDPSEVFRGVLHPIKIVGYPENRVESSRWSGFFTVTGNRCRVLSFSPIAKPSEVLHSDQGEVAKRIIQVLAPNEELRFDEASIASSRVYAKQGSVRYIFNQVIQGLPSTSQHSVTFLNGKFQVAHIGRRMLPPENTPVVRSLEEAREIAVRETFAQRPVVNMDALHGGFKALGVLKTPDWLTNPPADEMQSQIGYRFDFRCNEVKGLTTDRQVFVSAQTSQVHITGPVPPYFSSKDVKPEAVKLTGKAQLLWKGKRVSLPVGKMKTVAEGKAVSNGEDCVVMDGKRYYKASLDLEARRLVVGEATTYELSKEFVKTLAN